MSMKGLGRGLDSLFPTDFSKESVLAAHKEGVQDIEITKITPKKDQPRTIFDDESIEQLSYSIKTHGVIQPLIAIESDGGYTLIAGERRLRAAKLAGLKKVPVVVRSANAVEQLEIALVENIQRKDLSPLEQARSIQRLKDEFSQPYETIAKRLGKATTTVTNIARLLKLQAPYQKALADEVISEGHARALLSLEKDVDAQATLFKNIVNQHWSVRRAELFVQAHKQSGGEVKKQEVHQASETQETKRLEKRLGVPVRIKRTAKGGSVTIQFKSEDELDRILTTL